MNRENIKTRDDAIARMALYDHMNLREIGERFGITREAVRRVLVRQGIDYQIVLERRRYLRLVSEANFAAAIVNPVTIIQHGSRKGKRTSEYAVYRGMLQRCYDPNATQYSDYGGRGISVCGRWRGKSGYVNFLLDMGPRPPGVYASGRAMLSIHRKNNDGPYSPENCVWATQKEQCATKRPPVRKAKLTATSAPASGAVDDRVGVGPGEGRTVYRDDIDVAETAVGTHPNIDADSMPEKHGTET
jgi:hypothetical protein